MKELCKERNIFFVDNLRKIKAQHIKGKLHLNKKARILGKNFINVISTVLHWKADGVNPNDSIEECNITDTLTAKTCDECNTTLKNIRSGNWNRLIFADVNIDSVRSKLVFRHES